MIRCSRIAAAIFALWGSSVAGAAAQELQAAAIVKAVDEAVSPASTLSAPVTTALPAPVETRRPVALLPLYVSFGALQILDAKSTLDAVARGGVEANPVMKGFASKPLALVAVKAAGTTGVVFVTEKMWRKNKPAAIVFMLAANSAMALVVNNNYRAAR